jgi:membrane-bound serine protease (ClpP class)
MKKVLAIIFLCLCTLVGAKDTTVFYRMRIDADIDKASQRQISEGIKDAVNRKADYIILDLDTYGGAVDAADSIRSAILRCEIPVISFVNMQAASAGALISIACDSIYMKTGSSIGAATVVNQSGDVMPDKYQSFMRGMMRSTAQANGRDPKIAESMVDTANVLSLTPEEAMKVGYCEGIRESAEEVAQQISQGGVYEIVNQHLTLLDRIIQFLLNPLLQSIFVMMIVGGVYMEIRTPGIGIPLLTAVVGAILYFSPLFLEDLAQNWEVFMFIAGLVLIGLELFAFPGFGVCGVSGIVAVVLSLALALVDNAEFFRYDGSFDLSPLLRPLGLVSISSFVAVCGSIILVRKLFETRSFDHIALRQSLDEKEGFVGVETGMEIYVGEEVTVFADLKPSGKIISPEGRIIEASIDYGYAEKGTKVRVVKAEGGRLYCVKL